MKSFRVFQAPKLRPNVCNCNDSCCLAYRNASFYICSSSASLISSPPKDSASFATVERQASSLARSAASAPRGLFATTTAPRLRAVPAAGERPRFEGWRLCPRRAARSVADGTSSRCQSATGTCLCWRGSVPCDDARGTARQRPAQWRPGRRQCRFQLARLSTGRWYYPGRWLPKLSPLNPLSLRSSLLSLRHW